MLKGYRLVAPSQSRAPLRKGAGHTLHGPPLLEKGPGICAIGRAGGLYPNKRCHPKHAYWNEAAPCQARGQSAQPMLYQQYVPRQRPENLLIRVVLRVGQKMCSTRCKKPKQQRAWRQRTCCMMQRNAAHQWPRKRARPRMREMCN